MYVHEALILVLAASCMGGTIGVVTAIAFTAQQAMFTQVCVVSATCVWRPFTPCHPRCPLNPACRG